MGGLDAAGATEHASVDLADEVADSNLSPAESTRLIVASRKARCRTRQIAAQYTTSSPS